MLDTGDAHHVAEGHRRQNSDLAPSRRPHGRWVWATAIVAVVVLGGAGYFLREKSQSDSTGVTVFESDLRDPARLESILAESHVKFRIQRVTIPVVDGVELMGCDGPQGSLPQIEEVLGEQPIMHRVGNKKALSINTSAIPKDAQMSFIYWLEPRTAKPSGPPIMSLHRGAPPTCKPATTLPTGIKPKQGK